MWRNGWVIGKLGNARQVMRRVIKKKKLSEPVSNFFSYSRTSKKLAVYIQFEFILQDLEFLAVYSHLSKVHAFAV